MALAAGILESMYGLQPGIMASFYAREQGEVRPMATATQARIKPEDLLEITDRPMPELIGGQLVEREPMGLRPDAIASRLGRFIGNYADDHQLGLVTGAQGSFQIFPDDPNKVRIPDGSFTNWQRLPDRRVEDGHGKIAPDLILEVLSPSDRMGDVSDKIQDFLAAGVRLIWVVNPYLRDVQVYRANRPGSILQANETLDGEDVLPGFQCKVESIFNI